LLSLATKSPTNNIELNYQLSGKITIFIKCI
jgi:hypothetical protein